MTSTIQLHTLRQNQRSLVIGLQWGGAVLAILTVWIGVAHPEAPRIALTLLGLLAASAFGHVAVWVLPRTRSTLLANAVVLAFIALWVAIGLATILAFWFALAQPTASNVALALLSLFVVAAFAHLAAWFFPRTYTNDATQLVTLDSRRRAIGKILVASGLVLVITALYLGIAYRLTAFGDSLGLGLLGLIAAGAGWYQLTFVGGDLNQEKILTALAEKGILATIASPFSGGKSTANGVRIVILIVGGLIGFLLTVTAFLWAWLWRNDVFLAGLSAWRGEQSWKLWLCAYASLLGLGVMFASLVLARPDLRTAPVFRRVLYGYNALLVGLLLLEFLVVLNIFVYVVFPMTSHWSESRGFYTLSDSAKDILQRLEKPTKIYVVLGSDVLERDTRMLLDNAQSVTDKLSAEYISPHQDFDRVEKLRAQYPVLLGAGGSRGLLVVYGDEAKTLEDPVPPHTMIVADKIAEQTESGTYRFKGEEIIMSELRFLSEGKKKSKIYFLQGNGELNLDKGGPSRPVYLELSSLGMTAFLDRLKKENYEVSGLSFGVGKSDSNIEYVAVGKNNRKDIPEDARVVVIAGPSRPIPTDTLDALGRYMKDRNGRMLVMLDMVVKLSEQKTLAGLAESGLADLLKEYGVEVTPEYVHRVPGAIEQGRIALQGDPVRVTATVHKSDNALANKFVEQNFELKSARILKPMRGSPYDSTTLLEVAPDEYYQQSLIWPENNYVGLTQYSIKYTVSLLDEGEVMARHSKEPLPVAVAVSEKNGTPRLIAIGDAEMISDPEMVMRRSGGSQFNLLASALDWLADRPGIGIRPKEAGMYQYPRDVSPMRMVLLPAWLMMLSVIGLGVGVWVVRRR